MKSLIIDPEFESLIPPLQPSELHELKESLIINGVMTPLIVWRDRGILVDGHNRYRLAEELGLKFETKELVFGGRDQVIFWILQNQLGRRNLRSADRDLALARLVEIRTKGFGAPVGSKNNERGRAGKKDAANEADKGEMCDSGHDAGTNGGKMHPLVLGQNTKTNAQRTVEKVAEETGVSSDTVKRAVQYKKALDELGMDKPPVDERGRVEPKKRTIERAKAKREGKPAPEPPPKLERWEKVVKAFEALPRVDQEKALHKIDEIWNNQ